MKCFEEKIHSRLFYAKAKANLSKEVERVFQGIGDLDPCLIKNHFVFQVGISIFVLKEEDKGYWILSVNYEKNPLQHLTEDLSLALEIERDQREFFAILGIEAVDSRFDDRMLVARNSLMEKNFILHRPKQTYAAKEEWDIYPVNGEIQDAFALYVFQFMEEFPSLCKILALPYEYSALIKEGELAQVWDDEENILWEK